MLQMRYIVSRHQHIHVLFGAAFMLRCLRQQCTRVAGPLQGGQSSFRALGGLGFLLSDAGFLPGGEVGFGLRVLGFCCFDPRVLFRSRRRPGAERSFPMPRSQPSVAKEPNSISGLRRLRV